MCQNNRWNGETIKWKWRKNSENIRMQMKWKCNSVLVMESIQAMSDSVDSATTMVPIIILVAIAVTLLTILVIVVIDKWPQKTQPQPQSSRQRNSQRRRGSAGNGNVTTSSVSVSRGSLIDFGLLWSTLCCALAASTTINKDNTATVAVQAAAAATQQQQQLSGKKLRKCKRKRKWRSCDLHILISDRERVRLLLSRRHYWQNDERQFLDRCLTHHSDESCHWLTEILECAF